MGRALRAQHGGSGRLLWLLTRYGEAIEADLAFKGWDLAALFRRRRWRFLLNLIDHLPSHSAFSEAQALDEELAERYADSEPDVTHRPRITEWSATEQLLAAVFDRLGEVVAATIASGGNKPPKMPDGWPRPETAAERVLRRRQHQEYDDLLDLVEASKQA